MTTRDTTLESSSAVDTDSDNLDSDRTVLANTLQSRGWKKIPLPALGENAFELRATGANGNTVIVKVWRAGFIAISDSTGPVASCGARVPTASIITVAESVRSLTV